jgi:putative MFS transporter
MIPVLPAAPPGFDIPSQVLSDCLVIYKEADIHGRKLMSNQQSVSDKGSGDRGRAGAMAEIEARLDRLPPSRFSYLLLLLLMPAWIVESYDIGIIGATIAVIKPLWHPSASQLGLLGVASTVAIALGLIPSGILVDALGRRRVFIGGLVWFSVFTGLTAFAPNIEFLAAGRFAAGLGLGAVFPLPYVFLAEFMAPESRAKFVGYLNGLLTAAYVIPPLTAVYVLAHFPPETAWRLLYGAALLQLIYAAALYVWLPESPRWLVTKGRTDAALAIVSRIEAQATRAGPPAPSENTVPTPAAADTPEGNWRDVLRPPLVGRTMTVCLAFFGTLPVFYVLLTFAPTLMAEHGLKLARSLEFVAALQLAGGIGGLIQGFLADKWGRRPLIIGYGLMTVAGLITLAFSDSIELLLGASLAVGFFGLGIFPVTKLYVAEQFPTSIRGSGTAVTEAFGRFFGGVVFVYLVPSIVDIGGVKLVVGIVAALLFFATVFPVAVFGRETRAASKDEVLARSVPKYHGKEKQA